MKEKMIMVHKEVTEELRIVLDALIRFTQVDYFLRRIYENVMSVYPLGESLTEDEWVYLRVKLLLAEAKLITCPSQCLIFKRPGSFSSVTEQPMLSSEELSRMLMMHFPDEQDSDSVLNQRANHAAEHFFSLKDVLGEYCMLSFRSAS